MDKWGWRYNIGIVAEHNNTTTFEIKKTNVMWFLNELAYIRDKTLQDNDQARKKLQEIKGNSIHSRRGK